jgi:hypothetical protein
MFAVPETLGVKLAWQLEVPRIVPGISEHGELAKLPVAPVAVKVIVPAGLTAAPEFDGLSVTVAVHVEGWFTTTRLEHDTVVIVIRRFTVTVSGELCGLVE